MFVPDTLERRTQKNVLGGVSYHDLTEPEGALSPIERLERLAAKIAAIKSKATKAKEAA